MPDKPSIQPDQFKAIALDAVEQCTDFLREFPELTVMMEVVFSNGQVVVVGIKESPH